jgi:hypothetical protein
MTPTNASDKVLSSIAYQSGRFGRWYQPTNSALVNQGSLANAGAAGLYHHTVHATQAKEGTSQVDIGYHYIAVDGFGNPMDTDGDGAPDFSEDRDGDGTADAGEGNWQSYNSANGGTSELRLEVFTPLK